jgi:putative SOS response-associated peptidase YedK
LAQKNLFKEAYARKRCLIPANGFYEWKKEGKHKVPFWISPVEDDFFAFAGIYDTWIHPKSGEIITSSAIITTTPNALMQTIHERMPVILPKDTWSLWLEAEPLAHAELAPLLQAYPTELMQAHEVSTYVNSPVHDDEKCIRPMSNSLF